MAPNLALAQREQIHAMLQAGHFTGDQIAKVAGCSSQSVSAIRSNIRAFGSLRAPFTTAPGRPRSITPTMFDALKELLLQKPDRQLDELAAFLQEEFDVDVSTSTISRTLIAEGWSKKMIQRKAKERNADLRDKYLHELSAFASYHLRVTATGPRYSERGNPASKRRRPCSVPWWQIKLQGADTICRTRRTMLVSEEL